MGCHFLLQGIFLTQGSNPGLPHCRQMLSHLSHQGSVGRQGKLSWLVDIVEGKGKMKDASYFLSRTQPMKSHGLLFTIALPAFFFNLHYLKFFSSMSYSFQSMGLLLPWVFIPKNFILFDVMVNRIVFFIYLSDSLFLVYSL